MLTVGPPKKKMKIERNKQTNTNRDPEKRNLYFCLSVEVKWKDEAHYKVCAVGWIMGSQSLGLTVKLP